MIPRHLLQAFARALCCVLLAARAAAADTASIDAQGYVRDWLMLAPVPLPEGGVAGDLVQRDQIKDESKLRPRAGDEARIGDKTLAWKKVTSATNYFDFNKTLNSQNDHAVGYLVAYVECDADIPDVTMAVGSNDQGRIYFNGVDIYVFSEARPLVLDADKGRVTLKKGVNVIVFKVVNETNSWQASMRLLDKSGAPLKDVRLRATP